MGSYFLNRKRVNFGWCRYSYFLLMCSNRHAVNCYDISRTLTSGSFSLLCEELILFDL